MCVRQPDVINTCARNYDIMCINSSQLSESILGALDYITIIMLFYRVRTRTDGDGHGRLPKRGCEASERTQKGVRGGWPGEYMYEMIISGAIRGRMRIIRDDMI